MENSQGRFNFKGNEPRSKSKPILMGNAVQAKIVSREYDASNFAFTFDSVVSPKKEDLNAMLSQFKPRLKQQKRESNIQLKLLKISKLQQAVKKAKELGYIVPERFANKDDSWWTQPRDPLHVKMDLLLSKSNLYSEDLYTHTKEYIDIAFLEPNEKVYLNTYADEQFEALVKAEMQHPPTRVDLFKGHPEITRHHRMMLINWMFEVMEKFDIEEKQVLFSAIELMDNYYARCKQPEKPTRLQLVATTAFFIAAKNIMIDPFTLNSVIEIMCRGKYSMKEFLHTEGEIISQAGYVCDQITLADFVSFLFKVIRS